MVNTKHGKTSNKTKNNNYGFLSVKSKNRNVKVLLNDKFLGYANNKPLRIPAGEHVIVLEHKHDNKIKRYKKKIRVEKNKVLNINF